MTRYLWESAFGDPALSHSLLLQTFVFLLAALVAVPIAKRLGLGSVLGYLIAGAIIGPFGLQFFGDPQATMRAAEFGVIIMLFLIGLELQPALLWRLRTSILGMGAAQMLLCAAALAGIVAGFGLDLRVAVAIGLILALSSTAIVMQSLRERGIQNTHAGRSAFSILLFQDLAIIPMLAFFPLLASLPPVAGEGGGGHGEGLLAHAPAWLQAAATFGAIAAVALMGRFVMRPVFRIVAATRLQEMFTALALLIVVGVTLLMQSVGLSPALGAFLAGVVLADSEFRHEIETDIEPFRGLLLGLFFVSVGASIDFALLMRDPMQIAALVLTLIAVKALVIFALARGFRRHTPDAASIALALAQGGEFAFVLSAFALTEGVLPADIAAKLNAVVALSMAATPLLFIASDHLSRRLMTSTEARAEEEIISNEPAVIIAGYGRVGQTVGRLMEANNIRVSVLEHDAEQVDTLRGFGRKVNYGDATRVDLLRAAGAEEARILVVAIDDQERAIELVRLVKQEFPHLRVIARAFDRRHFFELYRAEADEIERETFESSLKLGVKALKRLGMDPDLAERSARLFRLYDEKLLREMEKHWGGADFAAYQRVARDSQAMFEDLMRRDISRTDDALELEEDKA